MKSKREGEEKTRASEEKQNKEYEEVNEQSRQRFSMFAKDGGSGPGGRETVKIVHSPIGVCRQEHKTLTFEHQEKEEEK